MNSLEILKERLAKGEISLSDYRQIASELTSSRASDLAGDSLDLVKKGASKFVSTSSTVIKDIFGTDSVPYPTNNAPFVVTKNLHIFGDFFEYKSVRFDFSEIVSLSFFAKSETMNFIPMGTNSDLCIWVKSGKKIEISGASVFIKGKTNKYMSIAYSLLSQVTYNQRLRLAVDKLSNRGGIIVDGVTITKDGYFRKGGTSVNIRKAALNENLVIGTYFSFGMRYKNYDPYEVVAGENGTSILSSRVRFSVKVDTDVNFHIIRSMADGKL
jgi:hypothetical protein